MSAGKQQSLALTATFDGRVLIHLPAQGVYTIWRMGPDGWGEPIWNNHELGLEFVDFRVVTGVAYEYKARNLDGAMGYLLAGSKIHLVESRGKLVLVIEAGAGASLIDELGRFVQDLAGDGYETITRFCTRTDTPEMVKARIKEEWEKDKSNVRTVILFGACPIFMSGPVNYDGHGEVMVAADGFYADMTGDWSGSPSIFPAKLDLILGRIDFSNETCFSNKVPSRSELDLLREYLNRNSAFRRGQWDVTPRGAIRDGFDDRDFSRNGWGNMPQLCRDGIDQIVDGYFFPMMQNEYLIAFAAGGGQLTSMAGVGGSDDFATTNIQCPFVMLLGSAMLGRWNSESNFVRSCLASGTDEKGCLVAFGAGAPHVWLHPCGLGEPIGSAWLRSVNNFTIYPATGNPEPLAYTPAESDGIPPCLARVHEAFLGDPTLTLFTVKPIPGLIGQTVSGAFWLIWTPSPDVGLDGGYHVYRSANPNGPFARLTTDAITGLAFEVTDHFVGVNYMVRAVALVTTPSGSFYQASCGVMWSDNQTPPMPPDPGTTMSKATFIKADTETQGNRSGKYGEDGAILCTRVAKLPPYAVVTPSNKDDYVWSDQTQDPRALLVPGGGRLAAVWVADIGFTIDVKSDALPHRLALYCLDWDAQGRSQRVEVLDGATGALLVLSSLVDFNGGTWLVYDFQGSLKLRVTKISGPNCVISAIMFGPAGSTPAPTPTPTTRTLEIQSGPSATGPWIVRGTVEVEATAEKEFYRLGVL